MKRKHILYAYATPCLNENIMHSGPTIETSSIEISDTDELVSIVNHCGPTFLTETIENSDADEFQMEGPPIWTKRTFSLETSDDDEFIVSSQRANSLEDFDDILLL